MNVRGRFWVGAWLVFFLATLAAVAWRQSAAVTAARTLGEIRQDRSALEAEKAQLVIRIREARSRSVLIPRAESLGLRLASDSEIVDVGLDPVAGRGGAGTR